MKVPSQHSPGSVIKRRPIDEVQIILDDGKKAIALHTPCLRRDRTDSLFAFEMLFLLVAPQADIPVTSIKPIPAPM
jgi:hypothetical protein